MLSRVSRAFLYRHPAQLALALIGVAAGVTVMVGVALLRANLLASLDGVAEQLSGSDSIRIQRAAGDLDEAQFAALARRPGAPVLMPVVRVTVRHANSRLEVLGIDPFSLPASGAVPFPGRPGLCRLSGNGAWTSPATLTRFGLEVGEALTVQAGGREHIVRIDGTAVGLDDRLVMDIAEVQARFGRQGGLSYLLAPAWAHDWLAHHLPADWVLVPAEQRRESARRLTAGLRTNLTAMSLLALATGMFVVFSVMSFLMVQRRRQFGILRAIGVSRAGLGGMLAVEALVLSGLGSLLGLVAGTWLAGRLLHLVRGPVAELYRQYPPATVAPSGDLYLAIGLAAVCIAVLVVLPVIREAMQVPPGRLIRASSTGRRRSGLRPGVLPAALVVSGLVLIGLDAGLLSGLVGMFLILAGSVLVVPGVGFALIAAVQRRLRGHLVSSALGLLSSARHRLAPALAALSLAMAISAGMGMMILEFRSTVADWVERLLRADLYVSDAGGPLDPAWVERVQALESVRALSSTRARELTDGLRLVAYDLPPAAWQGFDFIAGDPDTARQRFLDGEAVLVSEALARRFGLVPGDLLPLPGVADALGLEVAAVFRDYSTDLGFVAIDGRRFRAEFGDFQRDSLGLYLAAGVEVAMLLAQLEQLEAWHDGMQTIRPTGIRDQTLAIFDRTFRISWALAALIGLIALVALTSSLLAMALERVCDYATLRALGLSPRGLILLVVTQTALLATTAAILALVLALGIHYCLVHVVQPRSFGWSLPLAWPPLTPLLSLPVVIVFGALAGLIPAWKIGNRPIGRSLRPR